MISVEAGKPGEARIKVIAGASLRLSCLFKTKSTGVPIDWTGYTFSSQIRKDAGAKSKVLANIAVTAPTPANGTLIFVSDDVQLLDQGTYRYDVKALIGEDSVFVLSGPFEVLGSITRD